MAQIIDNGSLPIVGCMDPMASNYDPSATVQPQDICLYGTQVVGCTDPLASNYNPLANVNCNDCCLYVASGTAVLTPNLGGGTSVSIGFGTANDVLCPGPFAITIDNEVLGVTSTECCNALTIGNPPPGYEYYWQPDTQSETQQGGKCILRSTCPTDLTCVDCNNFDWWNDTYILNHNGQGLQVSSPILWQQLVSLVANSGQTFYVQTSTGNLLDEVCCGDAKGTFRDGVCFCETPIDEIFEPRCISNINDFITFVSTTEGYNYFVANSSSLAGALDLTNQQMTFIVNNFFNTNDSNGNSVPDMTEARLLMSNALGITGGFYVNFGTVTNTPTGLNKGICDSIGGYWDTVPGQCMCQPLVDQCDIDITMVQTTTTTDFYGNTIQIVTQNGTPISEACCNRLIKDYDLPLVCQVQLCYATQKEYCLPFLFTLNDKPMDVPACGNDLELSMWVYFGKPENPCQPIPDPPDDDVIIIDGEVCDITLTPNTGAIVVNPGVGNLDSNLRSFSTATNETLAVGIDVGGPRGGETPKTCCYSNLNPILARITTTNPILNPYLVQVKEYNSNTDYFDRWVKITATLPTSGLTLNFGVNLEIYQGLNCCCNYDIFVDDIRVNCAKDESLLVINDIQCPGFELTRVIDNKKSWVYNPGTPEVGISDYDVIERADGSFGMLNGEGIINRTFAPSLDADIPWRYTDYWNQSSVHERHSNLVLNTKELGLTFDMCADCPISGTTLGCPDGYTFSGNTLVCYKCDTSGTCPSGYSLLPDGVTCQKIETVPAIFNGILYSATTATTLCMSAITYGELGGVFYENVSNLSWPITARTDANYHTLGTLGDGTNTTVSVQQQVLNTLWGNGCPPTGATCNTRLNEVGIWSSAGPGYPAYEWIGFSSCVDLPYSGTYSVGIAGDDYLRMKVNGQLVFDLEGNGWHFLPWRVFPINLNAGTNLIELEVKNIFSTYAILGAEIYSANTNIISGITNSIDLDQYVVFSTKDKIGQPFDLGETSGYSCPSGYALNTCGSYTCSIISTTAATQDCCVTTKSCPSGYTDDGSACVIYNYTAATCNSSGCTVYTATTLPFSSWSNGPGQAGGYFYEDITGKPLVVHALTGGSWTTVSPMVDGLNNTINVVNTQQNNLWGGGFPLYYNRLNSVGIWTTEPALGPEMEWIGFTNCVEIPTTKTYVLGMAADDAIRVSLNNQLLVDLSTGDYAWSSWRMFPITLNAGTNVFKIEGIQAQFSTPAFFGFEIYDASVATLTGVTTTSGLTPYIVFSTADLNGQEFNVGENSGYSCPSGYSLDCSGNCVSTLSTGYIYDTVCNYITTSAITVNTVTYLSLLNLENYKKTFQSFWIPFMEQFIPATTIWVAGERWCNEPCTIINPCDYDFELTDAEISIQPVPPGFFPNGPRSVGSTIVTILPTTLSATVGSLGTVPSGSIPTSTPNILSIQEIGLVSTRPNIPTDTMVNVDLQAYRSRFTAPITEIITP